MVQYSRLHTKKVNSSFAIESFREKKSVRKDDTIQMLDVTNLGMYLVIPLLVGLGLGLLIDSKMGIKPIGVMSGLLLGLIGSFFNLIKIVRRFSKNA